VSIGTELTLSLINTSHSERSFVKIEPLPSASCKNLRREGAFYQQDPFRRKTERKYKYKLNSR
ncbi:hypothetical protein, partial [Pontibacter rugosus]